MSAPSTGTVRIVCFEEAGECTLERVAREAVVGDRVVAIGPERWAIELRALGLAEGVEIGSIARAALPGGLRDALRRATGGSDSNAVRLIAYGTRARGLAAASTDHPVDLAAVAPLPPEPHWPEGRRARIRRELGLAPGDFAMVIGGDPSEWIDPSFPTRAMAMARVAGVRLRTIASPRIPGIDRASEFFARATEGPGFIIDARADRPWELLPATEALVLEGDGLATRPSECGGWRSFGREGARWDGGVSPLPALWALACGRPALVHASVELGRHEGDPRIVRYDRDVAALARAIQDFATSASAASR